jgi:hypothetical protein
MVILIGIGKHVLDCLTMCIFWPILSWIAAFASTIEFQSLGGAWVGRRCRNDSEKLFKSSSFRGTEPKGNPHHQHAAD